MTKVFHGEITGLAATFPEDGAATVDVHCHSFLHRLGRSAMTKTFLRLKDSAIAAQIGAEAACVSERGLAGDAGFVLQYNQTNLEFLLERASRIGFELLTDGKTLVFREATDQSAPVATLTYGRPTSPLLSMSLREELLGQGGNVTVRAVDPISGEPDHRDGPSTRLAPSPVQARSGARSSRRAFGATDHVVVDRPIATKQEADQLAQSILNGRARSFLTGSGRSLGLPALRAGGVVKLGGLARGSTAPTTSCSRPTPSARTVTLTGFRVRRNSVG